MSIEYVRAVLEMKKGLGVTARALLVAIAEHANDQGLSWPGNRLLADETEISERQIQRLIPELENRGLLTTVRPGNGKGNPRLMRLLFPPATLQRVTTDTPKGDNDDLPDLPKGDNASTPTPQRVTTPAPKGDNAATSAAQRVTTDNQRVTTGTPKGDTLPEKTAHNPNYNPNYNPTAGGEDLDLVIAAQPPARPAASLRQAQAKPAKPPKVYPLTRPTTLVQSPHLRDPRKFKNGYIPAGQGSNPVEVWYESFSIHDPAWRLSAPQEDDLVRNCPDLERLRPVLHAYRQHGHYAPRNLKLTFDWYRDGIPTRGAKAPQRNQNEPDYDFSSYQPQLINSPSA